VSAILARSARRGWTHWMVIVYPYARRAIVCANARYFGTIRTVRGCWSFFSETISWSLWDWLTFEATRLWCAFWK
jgi:hypothetical protein